MGVAGAVLDVNAADERLVMAVRRGDDRAFEQLYGRYHRRINAYVGGMVKDHGRAEDVTQEIFVSALRRMRATERPIAFRPWIYEIARNACIDQFRRTRRTDEVSFDADEAVVAAHDPALLSSATPDAAMDAKQQIDDLMGAFGGLSESHHDILVMRELEGLSYREIGERLGLSRPSVESTLFRARRRLTEEYEELVSGERCRRVSELLAGGAETLGTRDERRLARHVAHCQPCRRQAYAAGVDTATLTRHRGREAARRIAALFPVPAFLRFSHAVSPVAEPAAGWGKVLAAAAVIVAGGAGVAAHGGATDAATIKATPPRIAAAVEEPTAVRHQRVVVAPSARSPRAASRSRPAARLRLRSAAGRSPDRPPSLRSPGKHVTESAPVELATPPSASVVRPPAGTSPTRGASPTTDPQVRAPLVDDAVHQVENLTIQADGQTGRALTDVAGAAGFGH